MGEAGSSMTNDRRSRNIGYSLLARLDLDPNSLAKRFAKGKRLSTPDRLPGPYDTPSPESLIATLAAVPRKDGTRYGHPDLPGREYTQGEVDNAMRVLRKCEQAYFDGIEAVSPKEFTPNEIDIIIEMSSSKDVEELLKARDLSALMATTLDNLTIARRMSVLLERDPRLGKGEAKSRAMKDIIASQKLLEEFNRLNTSSMDDLSKASRLAARMKEVKDNNPDLGLSDFMMALSVIDELRTHRLQLPISAKPSGAVVYQSDSQAVDRKLEEALDKAFPETDKRYDKLRNVARRLNFYIRTNADGSDVAEICRDAVGRLRDNYSHDEVIRLAAELVDIHTYPAPPSERQAASEEAAKILDGAKELAERYSTYLESPDGKKLMEARHGMADWDEESVSRLHSVPRGDMLRMLLLHGNDPDRSLEDIAFDVIRDGQKEPAPETEGVDVFVDDEIAEEEDTDEIDVGRLSKGTFAERGPPPIPQDASLPKRVEQRTLQVERPEALALLMELMPAEKELVAGVLGKKGECNEADLDKFMKMHAGVRELLIRNFISSRWTAGSWKRDLETFSGARKSLYRVCSLEEPTPREKLEALMGIRCLSDGQARIIASVYDISADGITREHIRGIGQLFFSNWKKDGSGQWETYKMSIDPSGPFHWRKNTMDILTLGGLAHRMRYSPNVEYTTEESEMLSLLFGKELGRIDLKDMGELNRVFISPVIGKDEDEGTQGEYRAHIRSLTEFGASMRPWSIIQAAQNQSEFNTLLDFLGVPVESLNTIIDYSNCECRPKLKSSGYHSHNDDSVTSVRITLEDGRKIVLDGVFDGMGGHAKGAEDEDKTNGEVASGLARDVLEIFALSGWIRSPEDVRRALVTAHLTIVTEQIDRLVALRETQCREKCQEAGIEFTAKVWAEYKKLDGFWEQENDMGSTAVVSYQCGREFYSIHCGDSDSKVFRGGAIVNESIGHTLVNQYRASGQDISDEYGHIVTSALGATVLYVHINNADSDYEPFMLEPDDIIATASDGITVPVCDHEYPIVIDIFNGDLDNARKELCEMAEKRPTKDAHDTLCGCGTRKGKNDDKSLILRYAGEGL